MIIVRNKKKAQHLDREISNVEEAMLLKSIGSVVYSILYSLCSSQCSIGKTYKKLSKIPCTHHNPSTIIEHWQSK